MFGFGKKEEKMKICSCNGNCSPEAMESAEQLKSVDGIKVLGGGCSKCHTLQANAIAALSELGISENVELITDFSVIATYGVMTTPALVIDNKVVSCGKVLKPQEIVEAIRNARN